MYSYIIGNITEKNENSITLENGGIGYEVAVSSFARRVFENVRGEVKVLIYHHQRDDGSTLFGFYSKEEKEMFLNLITVSGIGPKMALTILSNVALTDLCLIIYREDAASLSSVKGIGKKTAERIIIELKDKVGVVAGDFSQMDIAGELSDACSVLVSLGMNKMESERLVKHCYVEGDSVEMLVTKALSRMRS